MLAGALPLRGQPAAVAGPSGWLWVATRCEDSCRAAAGDDGKKMESASESESGNETETETESGSGGGRSDA